MKANAGLFPNALFGISDDTFMGVLASCLGCVEQGARQTSEHCLLSQSEKQRIPAGKSMRRWPFLYMGL